MAGVSASQQLTLAGPSGFDPAPLLTAYALDHREDIAPELLSAGERDRLDVAFSMAVVALVIPIVLMHVGFARRCVRSK